MEPIFQVFLILHILGGSIGLIAGTINLIQRKGGKRHRKVGKIFLYGMLAAGFSSLIMALMHPNYFLFIVGVFTLYLVGTGSRYIQLKQLTKNQKPATIDWILTLSMLLFGIVFLTWGIYLLVNDNMFGLVLIVFGLVGALMVRGDFRNYSGNPRLKIFWLTAHIPRMVGAYIAAVTALLVVNFEALSIQVPSYVVWLLPTALLVPFIVYWTRKTRKKHPQLA